VLLLASEIFRLWFDREVKFASFQYFEDGADTADKGQSFVLLVADRHASLRHLFAEAARNSPSEDLPYSPQISAPIPQAQSILSDVDITVQQVNVTDILSRLRRWVSTPVEISGTAAKSGESFRASVVLPNNSDRFLVDPPVGRSIRILGAESEDDLAFQVACSLVWAEAAKLQPEIQAVERDEFCHWSAVWEDFLRLQQKHFRGQMSDADHQSLDTAYESLSRWIEKGITYPKYYQLRAALVDLMRPEKRQKLQIEAQNDRLRYVILLGLDPKSRRPDVDPLDEERAYQTLAEARPAIIYRPGKFRDDLPKQWRRLLEPACELIEKTARSTGWGRIKISAEKNVEFVGFLVAENVVATVGYAIAYAGLRKELPLTLQDEHSATFVFGNKFGHESGETAKITKVLRLPETTGFKRMDDLALLEIDNYDKVKYPPLPIGRDEDDLLKQLRSFVALVGYPAKDLRLPEKFNDALLTGEHLTKRVMPGRIVGFSEGAAGELEIVAVPSHGVFFTSDVSSMGGTGGGPLVNLETGKVVGVNHSGRWQNIRDGKFAYAQAITEERIGEMIKGARTIEN
jgi:hypothetical protein